jgi:hypothetical protein
MIMVQPDYTAQLKVIADALNRPATPAWAISLLSVLVGAVLSVLVQALSLRINDWHKAHKVRRIVYAELERLFSSVKHVYLWEPKNAPPGELPKAKLNQLKEFLFDVPSNTTIAAGEGRRELLSGVGVNAPVCHNGET